MMKDYDYIIAGSGAAGLSLVVEMIRSGSFSTSKILIVDREDKVNNDRTWCFWEKGEGPFEELVHKSWANLEVYGSSGQKLLRDITPYKYKLIRGIDFYEHCLKLVNAQTNITFLKGHVSELRNDRNGASLAIGGERYSARYIFSSIPFDEPHASPHIYLLKQHFKGWFIQTRRDVFDERVATLMDFRTGQSQGTTFFYIMPFSRRSALIEYTLFSPDLLRDEEYDAALSKYISEKLHLSQEEFEISSDEFGVIPMTNIQFQKFHGNIIHIGTAGGQTKGSSGYTFTFIQKSSKEIINNLKKGSFPVAAGQSARHRFYDSVLLNILTGRKMDGAEIFFTLFSKSKMQDVFKFLDNETNLLEDVKLVSRLPKLTFTKAALDHISRKKKSSKLKSLEDSSKL
jgi:lycopene beta-cyclase